MDDPRLFFPATERNRGPILEVLQRVMPARGDVLEIASGSGEHAAFWAPQFPGLTFQPSDVEQRSRDSIDAWASHVEADNIRPAIHLDVFNGTWPAGPFAAAICINMIHITPWEATEALMRGVGGALTPGGLLYMYGPYKIGGEHTSVSNENFEREFLKEKDPRNGVRDLGEVAEVAARYGLMFIEKVAMPANNFSVIFASDRSDGV